MGVVDLRGEVQGTAVQRQLVPYMRYLLRYSLKTLLGVESSLPLGVHIQDRPPGIGTRQQILAPYGLPVHG